MIEVLIRVMVDPYDPTDSPSEGVWGRVVSDGSASREAVGRELMRLFRDMQSDLLDEIMGHLS